MLAQHVIDGEAVVPDADALTRLDADAALLTHVDAARAPVVVTPAVRETRRRVAACRHLSYTSTRRMSSPVVHEHMSRVSLQPVV